MDGSAKSTRTVMRRLVVLVLVVSAAAAATLALGSVLGAPTAGAAQPADADAAHSTYLAAATPPLASLNKRFRSLAPSARCAAGATKARAARRRRAAALRGAAEAPPKILRRKRASMRRAIALLRSAAELCEAARAPGASPGAGAPPAPPSPSPVPGPPPSPAPPGTQAIALSASGSALAFAPASATATAGAMRLEFANRSIESHSVGVWTTPGHTMIVESPVADPGDSTFVDVTLSAGVYEIFCGVGTHAANGMVIPLTVTP